MSNKRRSIESLGERFSKLIVTRVFYQGSSVAYVEALCDCEKTWVGKLASLREGNTKSCGCFNTEQRKERFGKVNRKYLYWDLPREELVEIVSKSTSFTDIMRSLGLNPKLSPQGLILKLDKDKIDYSHIPRGKHSNKGRSRPDLLIAPTELFVFTAKRPKGTTLRKVLLANNLLTYECAICKLAPFWQDKELTLQVDHINNNPLDNTLENLRFLCPNCHTQTEGYAKRKDYQKPKPLKPQELQPPG